MKKIRTSTYCPYPLPKLDLLHNKTHYVVYYTNLKERSSKLFMPHINYLHERPTTQFVVVHSKPHHHRSPEKLIPNSLFYGRKPVAYTAASCVVGADYVA